MKTKYYVPVSGDTYVRYWKYKNGVTYWRAKPGDVMHALTKKLNWEKLVKDNVVREIQREEIAFFF